MNFTSKGKTIFFSFLAAILIAGCSSEDAAPENDQQDQDQAEQEEPNEPQQPEDDTSDDEEQPNQDDQDDKEENISLTKERAAEILQDYKNTFMVKTDSDGTVSNYDNKEELLSHFKTVMSEQLAQSYLDGYFVMENGELRLIATEPPVWLETESEFQLNKKDETTYHVVQSQSSELRGDWEYTFVLNYKDDRWIVSDVSSNSQQGDSASIEEKADNVREAVVKGQMDTLAEYVHPEEGLLISPYVHITEEAVVFEKEETGRLLEDDNVYLWGHEDGSGKPMKSTPKEYFQRYHEFTEVDKVIVDDLEQRGNVKMNIKEVFPESRVVEFYKDGTEENENMDWSSLYVVFQQDSGGQWKVVALVSGQWTI